MAATGTRKEVSTEPRRSEMYPINGGKTTAPAAAIGDEPRRGKILANPRPITAKLTIATIKLDKNSPRRPTSETRQVARKSV